jgi:hypothetical protein
MQLEVRDLKWGWVCMCLFLSVFNLATGALRDGGNDALRNLAFRSAIEIVVQ